MPTDHRNLGRADLLEFVRTGLEKVYVTISIQSSFEPDPPKFSTTASNVKFLSSSVKYCSPTNLTKW